MTAFTESVVEQAMLAWLESAGRQVRGGAETCLAPLSPEVVTPRLVAFESIWASGAAI